MKDRSKYAFTDATDILVGKVDPALDGQCFIGEAHKRRSGFPHLGANFVYAAV